MTTEPEAPEVQGGWWSRRSTFVKILIIGGGIFLVLMIIAGLTGGSSDDTASGETTTTAGTDTTTAGGDSSATTSGETSTTVAESTTTTPAGLPGIGDPVRDGKFEFVVMEIEEPGDIYDPDDVLEDEAKGKWFIVHMTVENIGDEQQSFFAGNQKVLWDGKELVAADFAWNGTSIETVNPGLVFDAVVMFDVPEAFPEGGKGTVLQLHDSALSGGVTVGL